VFPVYVSLGANIGDREEFLSKAIRELKKIPEIDLIRFSDIYETSPWGNEEQNFFLNQIIELKTSLSSHELLNRCQDVEITLGRIKRELWGPREIDIDLLIFGDEQIVSENLILPHPRLTKRKFILQPLSVLVPDLFVPGEGKTVNQLLSICKDKNSISIYKERVNLDKESTNGNATYIAIEGVIGAGKTSLARLLSEELDAKLIVEEADTNPYLKDFYRDPRRYAFQVQLFFLVSRYRQLLDLPQQDLFHPYMIADFIFPKDKIFAFMNLEKRDLILYERISRLMEAELPKPDLVIYLQSSTEKLLGNIRKRSRKYEKHMSADYIKRLNDAYNEFFFKYTETPLLVINTSEIDFVTNRAVLKDLMSQILNPPTGIKFYIPGNF